MANPIMRKIKPTIPEVLPLVKKLYERHSAGCCLHVVLDDGNVEIDFVEFSLDVAKRNLHEECKQLAELLMSMSITQRRRIYCRK